jgi:hypothetical protein
MDGKFAHDRAARAAFRSGTGIAGLVRRQILQRGWPAA